MALETGDYIDDLVLTNPQGTDPRRQGDDHMRLIKKVLTKSFPNIDGAVTATPTELNKTSDLTNYFPVGGIIMWAGLIAAIPNGWAFCDGNGTAGGIPIPDLTSRMILGADADSGGDFNVDAIGGTRDLPAGTTGGHAITENEMPAHTHTAHTTTPGNDTSGGATRVSPSPTGATGSTGGGSAHDHTLAGVTDGNLSPYYALAYIIKT